MQITKDTLLQIDRISLVLENCKVYDIKSKDIVDIWFNEIQTRKHKYYGLEYDYEDEYSYYQKVDNGRIVLSKNAFNKLSSFAYDIYTDETPALERDSEDVYYLSNRILGSRWCDICQIDIFFKDGTDINFYVDCDPIVDHKFDRELEYSNCPSAELDVNGDMLILFGKSSRTFHRIDNDYFNAIEGLEKFLHKRFNGEISVIIESIDNCVCCSYAKRELYMETIMQNKGYLNKHLPLKFSGVKEFTFDLDFNNKARKQFLISPTENGEYFVQFDCDCNFFCKKIEVAQV
ncbi:MAG: hypothetical protein K2K85_06960 [Clostridia bacterium]|nr:hypothetical protein [Clostridia bacterium]